MNNYKVNIKNGTFDLNDILIKVLNSEIKKYIQMICKNKKFQSLIINSNELKNIE